MPKTVFVLLTCAFAMVCAALHAGDDMLELKARTRTAGANGEYTVVDKTLHWDPKKTAVAICDMWDKHWCEGATRRVGEMAPRMNEVVTELRKRGALIIHCPSDTMAYYKDYPQRKLAQDAPKVETQIPLQRWVHLDEKREGKLPIDDSDGGCDCEPQCKNYRAWTHQHDAIKIEANDAITDSAEAHYLMQQRGIENLIVMGVHTNMCVLGRPFSIRQMTMQGKNVVLMRDMTDTMYNPRMAPKVDHFSGTDLVIEHIEKFWCPTTTSVSVIGGTEFHFKEDPRHKN